MSAAVPDGPSCAKRAEPPMTTMSPPPLDGLGSIFLAGESKESVCEFGMTVSVATDVEAAAAFERFNEYLEQKYDDDTIKLVKNEVELVLYNNRHMVKTN